MDSFVGTFRLSRVGRVFRVTTLIYMVLLILACASPPLRVQRAVARSDFERARGLLEDMGAGEFPRKDLSHDEAWARRDFEQRVTSVFISRASEYAEHGGLRDAVDEVNIGLGFCPCGQYPITCCPLSSTSALRMAMSVPGRR